MFNINYLIHSEAGDGHTGEDVALVRPPTRACLG